MNNQDLIARYRSVKESRNIIQDTWDYIERYIAPYRGQFFQDNRSESSQQWRKPWVYDATGVMSAQNLASSLNSRLTSASTQWFTFRFKQDELNDNKAAIEWLEEAQNKCFEALQESNFNTEVSETYTDLVCYGTSVILEEANIDTSVDAALNFKSVPIKECYFEEDHAGNVLNFYRHLQWTCKQIEEFFADQPIPEYIRKAIEENNNDTDKKFDILFCVFRRLNIDDNYTGKVVAASKRPYGFKYVLVNTGETIGDEGGYYEMPAFVPRWRTTSDSMWGNSPAMIALSDVMTLNRTIELNLAAVEKSIDPPTLTTSRGLIGDLDMTAGGLTTVRDVKEIVPFQNGARFDVTYQEMNRLRQNIESYFFIPQLILPPMEGTPATATEISVRMQQLEALIAPTLGRLQTDMLDPIVKRTLRILMRVDGALPDMPDVVKELQGEIDIQYVSPMARTLETSKAQGITRWLSTVANFAQVNPEVLDLPDWDAAFKELAKAEGVSEKLIRDLKKVASERKVRNENAAKQQEGQVMQDVGAGMQAMQGGMANGQQ